MVLVEIVKVEELSLSLHLLTCWLTSSKQSCNKQKRWFFGPPASQQAQPLGSPAGCRRRALLLTHLLLLRVDHFPLSVASSVITFQLQNCTGKARFHFLFNSWKKPCGIPPLLPSDPREDTAAVCSCCDASVLEPLEQELCSSRCFHWDCARGARGHIQVWMLASAVRLLEVGHRPE